MPVADPNQDPLAPVCAALGLDHVWIPVLRRLRDDLSEPLAWRRRFLADTEPITLGDLRVVALRMQGLGPTRIAHRLGRRSIPPRHQIDRTCLAVAVRLANGEGSTQVLAGRPGRTSLQLVQNGIPRYTDDPVSQEAFDRPRPPPGTRPFPKAEWQRRRQGLVMAEHRHRVGCHPTSCPLPALQRVRAAPEAAPHQARPLRYLDRSGRDRSRFKRRQVCTRWRVVTPSPPVPRRGAGRAAPGPRRVAGSPPKCGCTARGPDHWPCREWRGPPRPGPRR